MPGKAEDEPTNATGKEDPSHKAALNYSRFDALYVDDGDDLNFNELDLGLEFDSQHQQAHTLAHSPKPSALPPDEDEDEDENEERKPTHAKTLGEGLASFKTQSPSFSSDPSPRRLENEPNSADPASVSRVPESLHRDPRASFRCTENKPESSAMQGLEDAVGLPCPFNQFIPTKFTFYSRSPLGPVTEKMTRILILLYFNGLIRFIAFVSQQISSTWFSARDSICLRKRME